MATRADFYRISLTLFSGFLNHPPGLDCNYDLNKLFLYVSVQPTIFFSLIAFHGDIDITTINCIQLLSRQNIFPLSGLFIEQIESIIVQPLKNRYNKISAFGNVANFLQQWRRYLIVRIKRP